MTEETSCGTRVPVEILKARLTQKTLRILVADSNGVKRLSEEEVDHFSITTRRASRHSSGLYRNCFPALDVEMPFLAKEGEFTMDAGTALMKAAGVLPLGDSHVTSEMLPSLAEKMIGKIVVGTLSSRYGEEGEPFEVECLRDRFHPFDPVLWGPIY